MIILISGKLQSGKNTVGKMLNNMLTEKGYSVEEELFAKGLKDKCKEDFKALSEWLNEFVENISKYGSENSYAVMECINNLRISDENWYENKTPITRLLLQIYGTNIFRDRIGNDYWVKDLVDRVGNGKYFDFTIITDARFPNEIELLGISNKFKIRVNREIKRFSENHISETALDDYTDWDYVIENNGSFSDLEDNVRNMIPILEKKFKENEIHSM